MVFSRIESQLSLVVTELVTHYFILSHPVSLLYFMMCFLGITFQIKCLLLNPHVGNPDASNGFQPFLL